MEKMVFAVGLNEHSRWGKMFAAYLLQKRDENAFYTIHETLLPESKNVVLLSGAEKNMVNVIGEYSDTKLLKKFSKETSTKQFFDKISPGYYEKVIQPYIEKQLQNVFSLIQENQVKVFLRDRKILNVFEEDFLQVSNEQAKPVMHFNRREEDSTYRLSLQLNGSSIDLKDAAFDAITNYPAIVRVNHRLFRVEDIEAVKLKPFLQKDFIIIPRSSEKAYFKKFILNAIKKYPVYAEGFEIQDQYPAPRPMIRLARNFQGNTRVFLQFGYSGTMINPQSEADMQVLLHEQNGTYLYEKVHRDMPAEEKCQAWLIQKGLIAKNKGEYVLQENDPGTPAAENFYPLVEWFNKNHKALSEKGFEIIQENTLPYYLETHKLEIREKQDKDWFDIRAEVIIGEFRIPFMAFRRHILEGTREYKLPDSRIFILPEEWFSQFGDMLKFSQSNDTGLRIHKQHYTLLKEGLKKTQAKLVDTLKKLEETTDIPDIEPPEGLNASLRPYQQEGLKWFYFLQELGLGGCLADDMGLGKTIQTIALLLKNKEEQKNRLLPDGKNNYEPTLFTADNQRQSSLIVVPASLVHNWINEIHTFAPALDVFSYGGANRRKSILYFPNYDVIITSYHILRQDIHMFRKFQFHYIILDESQVIKNTGSQVFKAVKQLKSDFKIVLTGTPVENSLSDLWAQLHFVNEGLLGSYPFFRREFVNPIEKEGNKEKKEKLAQIIKPFILRRTKQEVAKELPPMTEYIISCDMSDSQASFYEEEKSKIRNTILENIEKLGMERSAIVVLQGLTRLRQISNHPMLVEPSYTDDSGKFNEVFRSMHNLLDEKHKVLVFSSFVKHLELFAAKLREENVMFALLTGSTKNREEVIRKFQEEEECRIFLISLKAGGVGLNLTAADYVFILDPWWNPAAEMQAVNRAHRIGQDKNVFVYRFISDNTIEEKIQKLQKEKSELAETFVQSNNPFKDFHRKDVEELLD